MCRLLDPISLDSLLPVSELFRRSSTEPLLPILSLSSLSLSSKLPWSASLLLRNEALEDDMPALELLPLRVGVKLTGSSSPGDVVCPESTSMMPVAMASSLKVTELVRGFLDLVHCGK